jgi:hypothetical protein
MQKDIFHNQDIANRLIKGEVIPDFDFPPQIFIQARQVKALERIADALEKQNNSQKEKETK